MNSHNSLTDDEFENKFKNGKLDPKLFNHEAHLRLAWIYINRYGLPKASESITSQLLEFVTRCGASEKLNITLTIASIKVVYHFMLKSKSSNFQDFISEFPNLKNNFKALISSHYSLNACNSDMARIAYIEPDLLPFDKY